MSFVCVCERTFVCIYVYVLVLVCVCVRVCVLKSWWSGLRSMCVCVMVATLNPVVSRVLQDAKERELTLEDTHD